ncbi:MAG: HD domain-containing protein [Bacilli bacterium]|nr:HD domain-containing protein [Bacilli bacterium]
MSTIEDKMYISLVKDILENEEFNKMSKIKHHDSNRFQHSLKVSYYSYRISKKLHLNYKSVARGGLLHDFFFVRTVDYKKVRDKVKLYTISHPKMAVINAKEFFDLTDMEEDIIRSHMFPIDIKIPKYAESWIVSSVDKAISTWEFSKKFGHKLSYTANFALLFIINVLK